MNKESYELNTFKPDEERRLKMCDFDDNQVCFSIKKKCLICPFNTEWMSENIA